MAEMDFSMYKQPRRDPLGQVGQTVGIVNALQQNKLLQQETESTRLDTLTKRQGQSKAALEGLGVYLGAKIQADPNLKITDDMAVQWLQDANNMGLIPDPTMTQTLLRAGKADPGGYRGFFHSLFISALPHGGAPIPIAPKTGPHGEQIPQSVTPERFNQMAIEGDQGGAGGGAGGGAEGGAGGGAPAEPGPGEAPAGGAPPVPPPRITGSVSTAAPIGTEKQTELTMAAGQKVFDEALFGSSQVATSYGQLDNILDELSRVHTGPGTEPVLHAQNLVNTFLKGTGIQFSEEAVASGEAYRKTVNQMALSLANAMGMSQDSLRTALGATPGQEISDLGQQKIIAMMKGLADGLKKKYQFLQREQNAALDENRFPQYARRQGEFLQNFDLRMFELPFMSQKDRAATLKQIKDQGGEAEFTKKFKWAKRNGLIDFGGP